MRLTMMLSCFTSDRKFAVYGISIEHFRNSFTPSRRKMAVLVNTKIGDIIAAKAGAIAAACAPHHCWKICGCVSHQCLSRRRGHLHQCEHQRKGYRQ